MATGWRYRLVSVAGTALITAVAVTVANLTTVQETFALVPYFGRPAPEILGSDAFVWALWTTLAVVLASMWPLFKPRPRRILDTILLTQKRVLLAMVALAALGYFNYSYRLPRSTLMLSTAVLLFLLPLFTVAVRRRPRSSAGAVIIGDDAQTMQDTYAAFEGIVHGIVTPPSVSNGTDAPGYVSDAETYPVTDLPTLGGFARLDEVLVKYDVDTALLAFSETDREEFFGTLEACYEHGITAMAHRDHADHVLTSDATGGDLLRVDLEPWDWQDYAIKRLFDVSFAGLALLVLSPLVVVIALAIKLDSRGPVLYAQDRTAEFGETFTVYKFRSMIPDAEAETGAKVSEEDAGGSDPRITRVGRVLRRTHLDEIPQLWSILVGEMSVVGPRPERPELDVDMQRGNGHWRRRWFVKPGLTGLAQIRGATGHDPDTKLRYDVEYIRRQSFWFDLKIVIRQFWLVGRDVRRFLRRARNGDDERAETSEDDVDETADVADAVVGHGGHGEDG